MAVLVVYRRRLPGPPDAIPGSLDLPPEPPAVAGFVADRFRVGPDAAPATLLDLAARDLLVLEQVGGGDHLCRLPGRPPDGLSPYEQRVFDHVRRRAIEGVVPAQALQIGTQESAARWWRHFRREVVADARARGLSRDLWDKPTVAALTAGLGGCFLVFETAVGFRDLDGVRHTPLLVAAAVGLITMLMVVGGLARGRRQRPTPAGEEAAARWVGMGDYLRQNESFPDLPPAAVAVWDRYLAYAAALGMAHRAVRDLPLSAGDDRRSWSSWGGRWRRVRVRYPRLRPGWGRHPLAAIAVAGVWGAPAAWVLVTLVRLGRPQPTESLSVDVVRWLERVQWSVAALAAAAAFWAALQLLKALADLTAKTVVTGQVVRTRAKAALPRPWGDNKNRRRWFVAVDDGSADVILAWSVRRDVYEAVSEGDVVTVSLRPRLAHVDSLAPVTAERVPSPA